MMGASDEWLQGFWAGCRLMLAAEADAINRLEAERDRALEEASAAQAELKRVEMGAAQAEVRRLREALEAWQRL